MVGALVRLGSRAFKTVSKPISSLLKDQATSHPQFRQLLLNFAQTNHRLTTQMQRRIYGHPTHVEIRPLNEEEAIQSGSDLIGGLFVVTVAGAAVVYEVKRSAKSEAKKGWLESKVETLKQEVEELVQEVKELVQEVEELVQEVKELAQEVETLIQAMKELTQVDKTLEQRMQKVDQMVETCEQKMQKVVQRVETVKQKVKKLVQHAETLKESVEELAKLVKGRRGNFNI